MLKNIKLINMQVLFIKVLQLFTAYNNNSNSFYKIITYLYDVDKPKS